MGLFEKGKKLIQAERDESQEVRRGETYELRGGDKVDISLEEALYGTQEITMTGLEDAEAIVDAKLRVAATFSLSGETTRVALLQGEYEGKKIIGFAKIHSERESLIQLENPQLMEDSNGSFVIGRSESADYRVEGDDRVSREHLVVGPALEKTAFIEDTSMNGTTMRSSRQPRKQLDHY